MTGREWEHDLRRTGRLQRGILPQGVPEVAGYEVAFCYEPGFELGGDFYEFIPIGGGRFVILVGSVSGLGMSVAILAAWMLCASRFCFRSRGDDLAATVGTMNDELCALDCGDRYATLIAVLVGDQAMVQSPNHLSSNRSNVWSRFSSHRAASTA